VVCPVCAAVVPRCELVDHINSCAVGMYIVCVNFTVVVCLQVYTDCSVGCAKKVAPKNQQVHDLLCSAKVMCFFFSF
jgi:hypothetical protein